MREVKMYIGGKWVEALSGETFPTYNPATGEEIARVPRAGPEDVDRAVEAARAAMEGPWGTRITPRERARLLWKLASLMRDRFEELLHLEVENSGKAITGVAGELQQAVENFEYFGGLADKIFGRTAPAAPYLFHYTVREPVGVAAQIIPWNYPLMMLSWKLAPALAAGCAVVVKPASATPLTALKMAELIEEAGFPPGVVNIVTGPGTEVGRYLVQHPGVDKVAFTGETSTGREIMKLAADGIKRVSLELGGKSPNIVFEDADLEGAIPGSLWAIFTSGGQSCEARSRILVHESLLDEFVEKFSEKASSLKVGDPMDPSTHIGSLISPSHWERVHSYVRLGVEEGARVVTGGGRPDDPALSRGSFYRPTVLAPVSMEMKVAQEEIFGPVAAIIPFREEEEAIALANKTRYGLAATLWTRDSARAHRVAAAIKAGVVTVNHPFTAFPGTPFGGYKESGFGRELGMEALDLYTEVKSVMILTRPKPVNPWKV
ncbi:MAG: aldehyde dehydrogenase family protein [Clostridiales bacterium]|nr:aldehyde dehydrogenase family protein [Clostridiales bacterium]